MRPLIALALFSGNPRSGLTSAIASVSEAMWLHLLKRGFMSALSNSTCPVCRTAEIVCGKWTLLLIRDLADGNSRFCELERSLEGISPRTLSLRLRALEEEGIVERHTYPEVPPRVEYALTRKGEALVPLVDDMRTYGTRWLLGAETETASAA
jgi:DNA-binding HxlR family transcriptional regulator